MVQAFLVEGGPGLGGEIEFRVGALVEQKVAQPLFATGADDKIRIRLAGRIQIGAYALFRDVFRLQAICHHVFDSPDNLAPGAVVQGQVQVHVPSPGSGLDGELEGSAHSQWQAVYVAKDLEGNALAQHTRDFCLNEFQQDGEQGCDLALRAIPVFAGKGVESQMADADLATAGDYVTHRVRTCPVAFAAAHAPCLRPAAIAVHNDGKMPWQTFGGKGGGGLGCHECLACCCCVQAFSRAKSPHSGAFPAPKAGFKRTRFPGFPFPWQR